MYIRTNLQHKHKHIRMHMSRIHTTGSTFDREERLQFHLIQKRSFQFESEKGHNFMNVV